MSSTFSSTPNTGAAVGAGSATAYYSLPDLQTTIRTVLTAPVRPGPSGDVETLQKLIDQLTREMRTQQPSISIVSHPHGNNNTSSKTTYALLLTLAATAAYLRYLRGWKWADFFFVTRSSLDALDGRLRDAMARLDQQVIRIRDHLLVQIQALAGKQDAALAAQAELAHQLQDTHGEVQDVHRSVRALEETIGELGDGLAYTNRGIYALCSVVKHLIRDDAGDVVAELDEYVGKTPPPLRISGGRGGSGLAALDGDRVVVRATTMPAELMLDCELRGSDEGVASRRPPSD